MFGLFKKVPKTIGFGRFNVHTTERQKMIKAILANSDNCGDVICGDPKLVKNIINEDKPTLIHKGNPEFCCQFYNFDKCDSCHMD